MGKTILVIGSLNADLVMKTPRCPAGGETLHGEPGGFSTHCGGKGANQAVACAKLVRPGSDTVVKMAGCVGDDAFGKMLREGLLSNGVDDSLVRTVSDTSSGVAIIIVETAQAGQNRICLSDGANACLSVADMHAMRNEIAQASMVVLQHEVPRETVLAALEIAHEAGVPTLLNPAPADPEFPASAFSHVSYLVPNETELALALGDDTAPPETVDEARKLGIKFAAKADVRDAIIVTLGGNGLLHVPRGATDTAKTTQYPAAKVKQVVDTTAAGDSFIGGFVVALLEGNSVPDALRFGIRVAGVTVSREGAQPSIPKREEL